MCGEKTTKKYASVPLAEWILKYFHPPHVLISDTLELEAMCNQVLLLVRLMYFLCAILLKIYFILVFRGMSQLFMERFRVYMIVIFLRISYLRCCSTMTGKTRMSSTQFTQFWIWMLEYQIKGCVQCPSNCRCGEVSPAPCANNFYSLWTGQVSRSQLIFYRMNLSKLWWEKTRSIKGLGGNPF